MRVTKQLNVPYQRSFIEREGVQRGILLSNLELGQEDSPDSGCNYNPCENGVLVCNTNSESHCEEFDREIGEIQSSGNSNTPITLGGFWFDPVNLFAGQGGLNPRTISEVTGDIWTTRSGLPSEPQIDGFEAFLLNPNVGDFTPTDGLTLSFRIKFSSSPTGHPAAPELRIEDIDLNSGVYYIWFDAQFAKDQSENEGWIDWGTGVEGSGYDFINITFQSDTWYEFSIAIDPVGGTGTLSVDGTIISSVTSTTIPGNDANDGYMQWTWNDDIPDPTDPSFDGETGYLSIDWIDWGCDGGAPEGCILKFQDGESIDVLSATNQSLFGLCSLFSGSNTYALPTLATDVSEVFIDMIPASVWDFDPELNTIMFSVDLSSETQIHARYIYSA